MQSSVKTYFYANGQGLTCTLGSLAEDPVHHLATHITERGAEEIVHLEPMGHVNLEPFPEELHRKTTVYSLQNP